ncbi:MAG: hypothetical protein MK101_09045 [Phycisphaerales bacterium]|nr:hypothetical protein [Phycisphaerales bacterium]
MTNLAQRIERLEAANARSRRRLALALPATFLSGAGLAVLMGASVTATDHVRTKQVDIIDDDGRTVLALKADARGGRLDLWSSEGHNLMRLGGNDHGGDVALWSRNGTTSAGFWATDSGGALALWNPQGDRLAHVSDSGATFHRTLRVDQHTGDSGLTLSATDASISGGTGTDAFTLGSGALTIGDDKMVMLTNGKLVFNGETRQASFSPAGIGTGTGAIRFADGGFSMESGRSRLLVHDQRLRFEHADATLLQSEAMDGHIALQVGGSTSAIRLETTPQEASMSAVVDGHGVAAMRVDDGGAHTSLHGDDQVVTLAARSNTPLLGTDDGGLTMHASKGAGAIELGQGEAGRIRLVAGTDGSVPAIELLDAAGLRAAAMSMEAAGSGAIIAGHGGTPTAIIRGRSGGGRLDLRGELGTVLMRAGNGPMAAVLGPNGHTQAMLAGTGAGGVLNLMDINGMPVVLTGASAEGRGGAAAFRNGEGATVVRAGSGPGERGQVQVVNPADQRSSTLAPPVAPVVNAGAR